MSELHGAIMYNPNIQAARLLLDRGAAVDARDEWGRTPLHWAASTGYIKAVELLLDRGADINAKDNDGLGSGTGSWRQGYGRTPLHYAAYQCEPDVVKLLLGRGADVNAKDKGGRTPLDAASEEGHTKVVAIIRAVTGSALSLDAGADVNAKDNEGSTALMRAAKALDADMVNALIAARADINAKDNNGWTALMLAANRDFDSSNVRKIVNILRESLRNPSF
jgi:ankyrin repeat protein